MKRLLFPAVAALSLLAFFAGVTTAQTKGAMELGYDLGFNVLMEDDYEYDDYYGSYTVEGEDVVQIGLPHSGGLLQALRFGFYLTEQSEIEPTFGFQYVNYEGDWLLQTNLGLFYVHNFGSAGTRPYVKGGGRVYLISDEEDSDSQFGLGAGIGAKTRIGDRLALRYEAGATRQFESEALAARWDLGLSLGISFFTK